MRFRAGLVTGFAAGFYLGTMSGRERYHQINRLVRRAKRSDAYEAVTNRAKAAVDIGVDRAKDVAGGRLGPKGEADFRDLSGVRLAPTGPGD